MYFSTLILVSFSLALATGILADADFRTTRTSTINSDKILKRTSSSLLDTRQSCQGTCQTCFGATYIDCPNSDYYCWDPTQGTADSQCSGSLGGGSPATPTSPPSPSITGTDTCNQKGASCQICFGAGSTDCPAGSYYDCYEPAILSESQGCNQPGSGGVPAPAGSASSGGLGSDTSRTVTSASSFTRASSASGILNTATSFAIGGGSSEQTSSVSRITRTQSSTSSGVEASPAASTESGQAIGAAPVLLGRDTGAVAVVAAGLLGVMGLL